MSRLGRVFTEFMNVEAVSRLERVFLEFLECRGWVSRLGRVFSEFMNEEAVSRPRLGDTVLVLYCLPKIGPFWDFPILASPPNTIPIQ